MRRFFVYAWHVWFYVIVGIFTIPFSPILLILTSSDKLYSKFCWYTKYLWAYPILFFIGVLPVVKRKENQVLGSSYVYISNHTSMLDIMMMMILTRGPIVFIGKKELARLPFFGYFYKKVSVLIDRSSNASKVSGYHQAQERLKRGISICIFPEGGVPDDLHIDLAPFKDGAFRLAIEFQVPIVPICFLDNKSRMPYSFNHGGPGVSRAVVLPFVKTEGLTLIDKNDVKQVCYDAIKDGLKRGYF